MPRRALPPVAFTCATLVALSALAYAVPSYARVPKDAAPSASPTAAMAIGPSLPLRAASAAGVSDDLSAPVIPPLLVPTLPPIAAPLVTPRPARALRVPVLMYHYISTVPPEQVNNRLAVDLRVPPAQFDAELAYLEAEGYHTISTPTLYDAMNGWVQLPPKPVILTFDDGYADAYTNAMPLLRKHGFVGTFFVTVNLIGRPGYMTWDQVKALDAAGMDIESHAMDHNDMTRYNAAGLAYQMGTARAALSSEVGHDVRFFAYPAGDYSTFAGQQCGANGYWGCFLKSGGSLQSLDWQFALHRTRVSGPGELPTFQRALAY